MHKLTSRSEYCCGRRKYNRRRFQCKLVRNRYRVLSLNYVPKTSNKKKPIDVFLEMTTKKPEVVINLGGNENGGEEYPYGKLPKVPEGFFGKKEKEPTPASEKSGGGEEFPFGKLPDEFFNKKDEKTSVIGKSGDDISPFDKMPKGFFVKKTTSTPVVAKPGADTFPFDKIPGDNFFDKFVAKQSKTTTSEPIPGRGDDKKTLYELPHEDLIKELERYEKENKDN